MPLLEFTDIGIYCRRADVYIDPWRPVERALITHAHSDHARWGMRHYLAHPTTIPVLKLRLGADISVQQVAYGETVTINGVKFTYFPAGHIPGSAQIRVEYKGEVWVNTGDYKLEDDGISTPWEPVACTHFITESTFGLPVYRWRPQAEIFADINRWWASNAAEGRATVVYAYSLGKAQRILNGIDRMQGPIYCHGAIANTNEVLRPFFPWLSEVERVGPGQTKADYARSLIIAPPSAEGTPWMRRFGPHATGICSGWMSLRGTRRRRAADRGFALSDHCDWPSLNEAIRLTGAEQVYVTHGYTAAYARYVNENLHGVQAAEVHTLFGSEEDEEELPDSDSPKANVGPREAPSADVSE